MGRIQIVLGIAVWLLTGHAIYKIYMKAGFINTPFFVFWVPVLNLAFLVYLALADWPFYKKDLK